MTYRGLLTRAQVGLVPPQRRSTEIAPTGTTLHYAGAAQGVDVAPAGHPRCLALWRGYQQYHQQVKDWADIAYTLGACQHGWLLAGRGAGVRTAATGPANGYRYAVCSILGGSETPTRDLLDAVNAGVTMLRNSDVKPAGLAVDSHRDHMSTSCAGEALTAHARTIDGRTVWVVDPDPEEDDMGHVDTISGQALDAIADRAAQRVLFHGYENRKMRNPDGSIAHRPDGTAAPWGWTLMRQIEVSSVYSQLAVKMLEGEVVVANLRRALDEAGVGDLDETRVARELLRLLLEQVQAPPLSELSDYTDLVDGETVEVPALPAGGA